MFRVLGSVAVAGAVALIICPVARAMTQGEINYIVDMTAAGMGPAPTGVDLSLREGYRVCSDLRSGVPFAAEAKIVNQRATGISASASAQLVSIAIKNLCPDQG